MTITLLTHTPEQRKPIEKHPIKPAFQDVASHETNPVLETSAYAYEVSISQRAGITLLSIKLAANRET